MSLWAFLKRLLPITITTDGCSDEDWSCKRKHRYGHEATALRAIADQAHKRNMGHYKCRYCTGWHLFSLE